MPGTVAEVGTSNSTQYALLTNGGERPGPPPITLSRTSRGSGSSRRGWAIGIYGSVTGLAAVLGPVLGGDPGAGLAVGLLDQRARGAGGRPAGAHPAAGGPPLSAFPTIFSVSPYMSAVSMKLIL